MSNEPELEPADRELERALASLTPVPVSIDPVTCAFEAGRHAGTSSTKRWRLACGALAAIAALQVVPLIALQYRADHSLPSEPLVAVEKSEPLARSAELSPQSHYRLTQTILESGVESLNVPAGVVHRDRPSPTYTPFQRHGL